MYLKYMFINKYIIEDIILNTPESYENLDFTFDLDTFMTLLTTTNHIPVEQFDSYENQYNTGLVGGLEIESVVDLDDFVKGVYDSHISDEIYCELETTRKEVNVV